MESFSSSAVVSLVYWTLGTATVGHNSEGHRLPFRSAFLAQIKYTHGFLHDNPQHKKTMLCFRSWWFDFFLNHDSKAWNLRPIIP